MEVDTCVKNMEHLSLPQDPAPSSPLLQGERGSSRSPSEDDSSSELSSSEGVWLVRKGEKMRESGEKIEKSGKAESFLPILLLSKRVSFTVSSQGTFIANP